MREIIGKISEYIKNNQWVLLVSLFFVGWKFFLISAFFNHEFSRSEESLIYIDHIDSINQCSYLIFCKQFLSSFGDYFGFEHLSYRLFFGSIGHLLKMNSTDVFHLSFYIGILIMIPSLIIFLKNIEKDKKLIAFSLFFLALYNGGGYHGFWWVVPDFFAVLLIFITFAIILGNYKHWKIILLILMPVGFYTHTIFVYLMTTTVFFYIFYSFFTRKIDKAIFKKIAFSIFILAIFYIPTSYYLKGNPYGPETFIKNSNIVKYVNQPPETNNSLPLINKQNYFVNKNLFPGFIYIKEGYFDWIFFNPVFSIIFIYIVFIVFCYKQYKILSLYFSALALTLASSIHEHSDRSLAFIWPMTFLLYAYGAWFSFKLINELFKNKITNITIKIFLYLGIAIFIAINLLYSYGVNIDLLFGLQQFLNNYVRNNW